MSRPEDNASLSMQDKESWSYFQEAALLRSCLAYNEDDFNFADRGGRITYIFDANIIAFFLYPERENERKKIIAFRSDGRAKGYAAATALITAEYLFSRHLAGQHNNPPFIAPSHGDDLADIILHIKNEVELAYEDGVAEDHVEHLTKDVEHIVGRIQSDQFRSIGQVANALRRFVPKLADDLENGLAPLQQLTRIYGDDLLRPLALHTGTTADILEPDAREVRKWSDLIRQERGAQGKPKSKQKSDRDASALVQVMMLDRKAADPDESKHRYVLVTADMALYDAYTRWYWGDVRNQCGRFVLRLPIQYIPVINTLEMPNVVQSSEITEKAMLALDSLFGNLKSVEALNYQSKLAYYRLQYPGPRESRQTMISVFGGIDPFEFAIDSFLAARQEWNRCYANATVLNASLMQRRHEKAFAGLVRALTRYPTLREAIIQDQMDSLSRIVGAHAGYMTPATAKDLSHIPEHRIPFMLRLEDCGLPAAVVDLLRGGPRISDSALQHDVAGVIGEQQTYRSLLLAAVVAYRSGQWVGARAFARHALSGDMALRTGAPPERLAQELRYLNAASTRYMIGQFDDLSKLASAIGEAREGLAASVRNAEQDEDDFVIRRARIEEQALNLTLIRLTIHGPLPIPRDLCRGIENAPAILTACLQLMDESEPDCSPELLAALATQTRRVAVGAAAQLYVAGPPDGVELVRREALIEAFWQIHGRRNHALIATPIHKLHYAVGEHAMGMLGPEAFASKAERIGNDMADGWSSLLDQRELRQTVARLRDGSAWI